MSAGTNSLDDHADHAREERAALDLYAAHAMQALVAGKLTIEREPPVDHATFAKLAFSIAEAMVRERRTRLKGPR